MVATIWEHTGNGFSSNIQDKDIWTEANGEENVWIVLGLIKTKSEENTERRKKQDY